jgi:hypothetical protein
VTPPAMAVVQTWSCPNKCRPDFNTKGPFLPNRFHTCPKAHGITAPLVRAGTSAKVEVRVREDYVNGEILTYDDRNKPVMSVITTRDNGQDTAVFAPKATAGLDT